MPRESRPEMIKDAFALYIKYNGDEGKFAQIEQDMHRLGWASFHRAMLKDRGHGEHFRQGWISRHGWENALKLSIAATQTAAATSAESLLAENEFIRKAAYLEIAEQGVRASKDLIYQHNAYSQNCIKILEKLEAARDNYANFVYFLQALLKAAPTISPALAAEIVAAEEALIEWAETEFVVEEDRPE